MRAICQRVSEARVRVGADTVGEIGPGLVVLLGVRRGDTANAARRLGAKVAALRVFEDDEGKLDRSLVDVGGEALAVSQFTLVADTQKGNRPSFAAAAPPDDAEPLYEEFCAAVAAAGVRVERGRFGAKMALELVNEGPVTIMLAAGSAESAAGRRRL